MELAITSTMWSMVSEFFGLRRRLGLFISIGDSPSNLLLLRLWMSILSVVRAVWRFLLIYVSINKVKLGMRENKLKHVNYVKWNILP